MGVEVKVHRCEKEWVRVSIKVRASGMRHIKASEWVSAYGNMGVKDVNKQTSLSTNGNMFEWMSAHVKWEFLCISVHENSWKNIVYGSGRVCMRWKVKEFLNPSVCEGASQCWSFLSALPAHIACCEYDRERAQHMCSWSPGCSTQSHLFKRITLTFEHSADPKVTPQCTEGHEIL